MKAYTLEQSNSEVKRAYSFLLDRLNEHVKLLAENRKPFTSFIGIKRGLLKLRISSYAEATEDKGSCIKVMDGKLTEKEELLASEIFELMSMDVKQAVVTGLVGEREMKRQLVRYHYREMAKQDMTYKEIKGILSERYGLSVSAIEKLVYRKHTDPSALKGTSPGKRGGMPTRIPNTKQDG